MSMCYENTKGLLPLILRHIREGNSGYIIDENTQYFRDFKLKFASR